MGAELNVTIDGAFIRSTGLYSPNVPVSGTVTTTPSGSPQPIVFQTAVSLYTEPSTSRTSSGNTANQTWVSNVGEVFVGVNVTAFTGGTSPTLVVQLQQQDANGIFQTIATSSTITPSTSQTASFSVGEGMTNGQMIVGGGTYRFAWVVTGAPATLSFQIGAQGR